MRDKIGSFMTRADCEYFLNRWITNYVADPTKTSGRQRRPQYPLQ